jgi:hypothetical protein
VSALESLICDLRAVCAGLPDRRQGPAATCTYSMADIGLSAFSLFFMGSPSFLAHQRVLAQGHRRSNCQTLFGMAAIPTDNHIRQMLDGAAPAAFDGLFFKALETLAAADALAPFQRLDGRLLIALDGTEYHCSRKIHCAQCSKRRRSDGGTEFFHAFLGASIVAPRPTQVLPLPPELIAPQDGAEKQDCERNAAKRWLATHGPSMARYRPIYLGDDLFACQPIAEAIHEAVGNFILTCKPTSHQTIAEYLHGAELQEHRATSGPAAKRLTYHYRWLAEVPLRASKDALHVNWFSVEILNAKGKRTYHNTFVTDLAITANTIAEIAACGRARWKIENETFNTLKNQGYQFEHNFGHGQQNLSVVFAMLMMLAFLVDQTQQLCCPLFRAVWKKLRTKRALWDNLRSHFRHFLFTSMRHLYEVMLHDLAKELPAPQLDTS